MFEIKTKYGNAKVFAETIENEAISQITEMSNSPLGENAHIRIMPDAHAGAGCVIGTTMKITDKVCANLVGVDIGCGVLLVKTNLNFSLRLKELDDTIRKYIPYGMKVHYLSIPYDLSDLKCWSSLKENYKVKSQYSLGTLGGGNHFIEAYNDGWIAVHSGSRNIGLGVATYYQDLAIKKMKSRLDGIRKEKLISIEPKKRSEYIKSEPAQSFNKDLAYLEGKDMEDYLYDIKVVQGFAQLNRKIIIEKIVSAMKGNIIEEVESVHNYIDTDQMILRKGAVSAQLGERLVMPMNMRDGILICTGKGNEDWNCSAPHGAGRLYSRSEAKEIFNLRDYKKSMDGIYSSCINFDTIDESPFAYKDWEEIADCIQDTVTIETRLLPIFNFKAN